MSTLLLPAAVQPPPQLPVAAVVDGPFLCEADVEFGAGPTTMLVSRTTARTNSLALAWLQLRAGRLADCVAPAFRAPLDAWLDDADEHESIRRTLALGQPYTLTVDGGDAVHRISARLATRPTTRASR
ncbi:hypothetical protein ACWCXH_33740 [Kitasatospora sp. NPDC001660]